MDFHSSTQILADNSTRLLQENIQYHNTAGSSSGNVDYGFTPAFFDCHTGKLYQSNFSNGKPAPVHLYDGLPNEVITKRNCDNKPIAVKSTVVSGFMFEQQFYTRDQAIAMLDK